MEASKAAVTARGVIDGEPAALDALAQLRGPSVLAYCRRVAAPGDALRAAADAFRDFRAAAIAAENPLAINPEKLLIGHTRRSAAALAPLPVGGRSRRKAAVCAVVPGLLAAEADGTLAARDRDRLRRHLARCLSCRDAKAAQLAGERAYSNPSPLRLTQVEHQALLAALLPADKPSANGNGVAPDAGLLEQVVPIAGALEADTALHPLLSPEQITAPREDSPSEPGPPPFAAPAAELPVQQGLGSEPAAAETAAGEPAPEPAGVEPVEEPAPEAAAAETPGEGPTRAPAAASVMAVRSARQPGPRAGLATRFVAPAAVLMVGLVIVLAVAGVFSSSGAHHAPPAAQVITPSSSASTNNSPAAPSPAPLAPRLRVPHGGPKAPAIPPGTTFANVKRKAKTRAHRPTRSKPKKVAPRTRTVQAPAVSSPTHAPSPAPAPRRSASPRARQAPRSTARELGSQGSAPPPQTGTAPAPGGFQPSN